MERAYPPYPHSLFRMGTALLFIALLSIFNSNNNVFSLPGEFCQRYSECRTGARHQFENCAGGFMQMVLTKQGILQSLQQQVEEEAADGVGTGAGSAFILRPELCEKGG